LGGTLSAFALIDKTRIAVVWKACRTPMRETIFEVGVSVAAAAVALLLVTAADALDPVLRWSLIAGTALVSGVAAWLAARRRTSRRTGGTGGIGVATGVRTKEGIDVEDVTVEPGDRDIRIAAGLRAKRHVRVSNVKIGRQRKQP